jgi:hypothetical protein
MAERTTKMIESHGVMAMRGPSARLGAVLARSRHGLDQGAQGQHGLAGSTWGVRRAWESVWWVRGTGISHTHVLWLGRWPVGWSG